MSSSKGLRSVPVQALGMRTPAKLFSAIYFLYALSSSLLVATMAQPTTQPLPATTTTAPPPPTIPVPSIATTEAGNITISLMYNAQANIQWVDAMGHAIGNPVAIVTQNDLNTMQSQFQRSIAALQSALQAQTQALNASLAQLTDTVNTANTALQSQINFKVDVRNLASINTQVQQVVADMTNNNPTGNTLAVQLGTKLTSSPTCQCFNPAPFTALSGIVGNLVSITNATLVCSSQGLDYDSTTDSCVRTVPIVECDSRIASLSQHASASCGLTPGGTKLGATCVATCNQGYNGGTSAVYVCNASGMWEGELQCLGKQGKTSEVTRHSIEGASLNVGIYAFLAIIFAVYVHVAPTYIQIYIYS